MAVIASFVCDCGCGAVRGETNHWFLFEATDFRFKVLRWDEAGAVIYQHACGSECVHKLLNAWIERRRGGQVDERS